MSSENESNLARMLTEVGEEEKYFSALIDRIVSDPGNNSYIKSTMRRLIAKTKNSTRLETLMNMTDLFREEIRSVTDKVDMMKLNMISSVIRNDIESEKHDFDLYSDEDMMPGLSAEDMEG